MDDQETSTVHLTVAQAARHAGVSVKTIRRWLSSGRLRAHFDGQAYAIDQVELERAASAGRPLDVHPVPSRGHGQVPSMSIVQELLDRLEHQAGEIATLRLERDQLVDQLRALQAPQADRPEIALHGPSANGTVETTQTPAIFSKRVPWWRFWRV